MIEIRLDDNERTKDKIDYWASLMRDMGRRNRLLFFKDTKASSLFIQDPTPIEIFDRIVLKNKPLFYPIREGMQTSLFNEDNQVEEGIQKNFSRKHDEFLSNKSINEVNRTLGNLRYQSRTIREEQGFNALYMGFGMLNWQEGIGSEFSQAPIVMVPIDINRKGLLERFCITLLEDDILINPTLQTKMSMDFKVQIDDITSQDLTSNDLVTIWEDINQKIRKYPGWEVLPLVVIGIFNFQTLILIKDLELNEENYLAHPIIRMLSGIEEDHFNDIDNMIEAKDLDEKVNPLSVFQILDADSSQQEAIEAAKKGVSFVLQGPPGTGKSQTIANIIAESIAIGKKVLFVSQKAVALDIVHNRLSQRGLGEFCLEVHNYKKNKIDVIKDLGKSLTASKGEISFDAYEKKQELHQLRIELNEYVKELHKPRFSMEYSLFKVLGDLSLVIDKKNVKFSMNEIKKITPIKHQNNLSLIRELISYEWVINNYSTHPWRGFRSSVLTIQEQEEISENLEKATKILESIVSSIRRISEEIQLGKPKRMQHIFDILRVISVYKPVIFSNDSIEIVDRLLIDNNSILKYIKPQYWKDTKKISEFQWREGKLSTEKRQKALRLHKQIVKFAIDCGEFPCGEANVTFSDVELLVGNYIKFLKLFDYTINLFNAEELPDIIQEKFEAPADLFIKWLRERSAKTNLLIEWINFLNTVEQGEEEGLGDFIEKALEEQVPPKQWNDVYIRRFLVLLSDEILLSNPTLSKFRSSSHNNIINRFKQLDRELIEIASLEIRDKLYKIRPKRTWVKADSAETQILLRELNKQRRIKPLRKLFSEIPNLLLNLKPCLMMSPLTVCQLLDPNIYNFDLAIFDEASQIPPEYAVGTIMRANQVIIAGDRHQLPPTRFFQVIGTDDYDEDDYDIDDFESILNACDVINMPNKMLLWHYRSKDEALIAFSNFHFYDNKLLTFPSSNQDDENGLEFIFVPEGIYRRGKGARDNPIEARKVAELVFESLTNFPELSIGVVTFSQTQRQMIEHEIDRIKQENPHLYSLFDYNKEEQVFVKNLETVQGDERDIIIFSVGYGKDELGKLSMNFGPLNRQGGERRLNVAVTRARQIVKLVSSIEPEDIDLSRTKSIGASLLKNYMKAARDGVNSIYQETRSDMDAEFDSPFESAVYESLTQRGVILRKQVGVSQYRIDFGVVDPDQKGRFLLGIECDGATYHSSPTARDRDRLRQQLLEEKYGWKIHRIWSRDWINDKNTEIQKVITAINSSKANVHNVKKN